MAYVGIGAEVEGIHAVAAAAENGRVRELLIEKKRFRDERYVEVAALVEAHGGRIVEVQDIGKSAVTSAPQGIVARCAPLPTCSLAEAIETGTPPAIVVLDHIVDPRNIGAIARTAAAIGMGALVVSTYRAAPFSASAFKAAAGALEKLPIVVLSSIADAVWRLEQEGVWTVGLDGSGDCSLFGLELLAEPVALLVGAEDRGLSRLVSERVSVRATLPITEKVESLNASVAASLAMFEIARVRGWLS